MDVGGGQATPPGPARATGGPPPEEVVAALMQMVWLIVFLAVLVCVTRAWQLYMDHKQAERAREHAAETSRQRLLTMSDRNIFYAAASSGGRAAISTPPRGIAGGGGRGDGSLPFSLDGGYRELPQEGGSATTGAAPAAAASAAVPASAANAAAQLLAGAAAALLQCRPTVGSSTWYGSSRKSSTTLPSRISEDCHSSFSQGYGSRGSGSSTGMRSNSLTIGSSSQHGTDGTSPSGSSNLPSGPSPGPQYRVSMVDTCRVFGSTPQDTITSTRQVLAAFNYDYSALRRREYTFVSGGGRYGS